MSANIEKNCWRSNAAKYLSKNARPGAVSFMSSLTKPSRKRNCPKNPIMKQPTPGCCGGADRWSMVRRIWNMDFAPEILGIVKEQPYPFLFVTISGAHLYGFPSPDSDYDLRGVHVLPVAEAVGLDAGRETIEVSGIRNGLEIDLVSHDARKFFLLMLK